jgi:hypothetical protein
MAAIGDELLSPSCPWAALGVYPLLLVDRSGNTDTSLTVSHFMVIEEMQKLLIKLIKKVLNTEG